MSEPTGTVRLHRVLRAPAERVYRAFLDAPALCKLLPPHGFTCIVDAIDAREGGHYHASFIDFASGQRHSFRADFVELVSDRLLRYTDRFDPPGPPGEMHVVVRLTANETGTDLYIEQSGIPAMLPVSECMHGWQESLNQLAALVEHAIPAA